jgi:hypothetical protein
VTAKSIFSWAVLTAINEGRITYKYYRSEARLNPLGCMASSGAARYLGEAGMANDYEQPVNWARIVVLAAASLPVFGGLYYALLDYLLFG